MCIKFGYSFTFKDGLHAVIEYSDSTCLFRDVLFDEENSGRMFISSFVFSLTISFAKGSSQKHTLLRPGRLVFILMFNVVSRLSES